MNAVRLATMLLLGVGIALPDWRASMASTAAGPAQTSTAPDAKRRMPSAASSPDPVAANAGPTSEGASRTDLSTALRRLSDLEAAHHLLQQRQAATDARLDRIEAEVVEIRRGLQRQQVAHTRLRRHLGATVPQELRPAASAASAPQVPQVLSVDIWNGRPSVSALVAGKVQFLAEGDVTGGALVQRADAATQRVEFIGPSGAVVARSAALGY